jgi:hypothetical protein
MPERTVKDELVDILAETLTAMLLREHGAFEEPRVEPGRRQRRRRTEGEER